MAEAINLGIWRNDKCVQCGACCYDFFTFRYGHMCPNQEIVDGKSHCKIYANY